VLVYARHTPTRLAFRRLTDTTAGPALDAVRVMPTSD